MNPNGHTTVRERLVRALKLAGGELRLQEVIFDYQIARSQVDDLLESAHSPIKIRLHYNGGKQPATMVVLKNYTPQKPVSQEAATKPVTQKEVQAKLDAMSAEEFYCMVDPTYKLRHQRRSGGGCRTSTSASEYPGITDSDSGVRAQ